MRALTRTNAAVVSRAESAICANYGRLFTVSLFVAFR